MRGKICSEVRSISLSSGTLMYVLFGALVHDILSGNRTSLFVIIDPHLIVHVLLIIECRGRRGVGSVRGHATHSSSGAVELGICLA